MRQHARPSAMRAAVSAALRCTPLRPPPHSQRRRVAVMASPSDDIKAAIAVGAPLFKAGRPADCYSVYRGAAQRLAAGASTAPPQAQLLRQALVAAAEQPADAAAWTLRRAFDAILADAARPAPPAPRADRLPPGAPAAPVLDCSGGLPEGGPRWQALDDAVMGGASSSGVTYDSSERALVFSGSVTTAFNGGFASVRSLPWPGWAALGRGGGVRLLVRGDGQTYKLNAKTDDSWDGVAWQADFQTANSGGAPAGGSSEGDAGWETVDIPFASFLPTLRGRVVAAPAPLDGGAVRQLGFMLSKIAAAGGAVPGFREGPFRLAVRAVRVIP